MRIHKGLGSKVAWCFSTQHQDREEWWWWWWQCRTVHTVSFREFGVRWPPPPLTLCQSRGGGISHLLDLSQHIFGKFRNARYKGSLFFRQNDDDSGRTVHNVSFWKIGENLFIIPPGKNLKVTRHTRTVVVPVLLELTYYQCHILNYNSHNASIFFVFSSHDGQYITAGSENQCVFLWRTHYEPNNLTVRKDRNNYYEAIKGNN